MNKVYILQDNPYSPKNFTPADEYGELIVIFNHHISSMQIPRCLSQLRDKLRGVSQDDWLIPVGHPALILVAGHVWFDMTSQLNVLVWDQQSGKYVPLRMNSHGPSQSDN